MTFKLNYEIAIAEGWTEIRAELRDFSDHTGGYERRCLQGVHPVRGQREWIPDYAEDLNATLPKLEHIARNLGDDARIQITPTETEITVEINKRLQSSLEWMYPERIGVGNTLPEAAARCYLSSLTVKA